MKRQALSLARVAAYDNLVDAFHKAAISKRYRHDVQNFSAAFESNLNQLATDIQEERLPYGRFRAFHIFDPKSRVIHAACFEDRIFHHALINQIGDTLERASVQHSYACRPQKGVHRAALQVQKNLQRYNYYVKVDIAGYFASISHQRLMALLARRFKGEQGLAQLERLISSYAHRPEYGLPIGSLSSQHFANYYLDDFDRFLLAHTQVRAQVRYMDDVVWWCDSKEAAQYSLQAAQYWLKQERDLLLKPNVQLQTSVQGITYCGFRILQGSIGLSRRRKLRYRQRRLAWEQMYEKEQITAVQLQKAYAAVHAIVAHTQSTVWRLRNLQQYPPPDV